MMAKFNSILLIFALFFYLSIEFECVSSLFRSGCPALRVNNGRVRTRSGGRVSRISCYSPFRLVRGNEMMTCVGREWDSELPICARPGCAIEENIAHGKINVISQGAKLEVECDVGYRVVGPSFVYCNEFLEWNDVLKGCQEHDHIYLSCDFESSDERFCGWKNDFLNDVDWLADKTTFLIFSSRRHVAPGSSQYFTSNYISLDTENYGSNTIGRLSSPFIPVNTKQKCLIFSYKVTSGSSLGISFLKIIFGDIPHWKTSEGEGRVIIGLYQFNSSARITIEGKNCKAAIDNMVITEGSSCLQTPYEEEVGSCHDNCGKRMDGDDCSCDWECQNNNNCCPDIKIKCPYIVPLEEIARLYFTTSVSTRAVATTVVKNTSSNVTVFNITSSKITNESKTLNTTNLVITTPMNEHNLTLNKVGIKTVTSSTPTSKITYSTFPQTPAIKQIRINVTTIPSITTKTEVPKSTLHFNSTLFLRNVSNLATKSSITESSMPTLSTISNIVPSTTKVNNKPWSTIKPLVTNTTFTDKLITTPNMTTKSLKVFTTFMPHTFNTNSSIIKPEIINTTISTSKLINTSLKEVKSLTTKSMSPFTTIIQSSIKPYISEGSEQMNIKSTTRSPKIMKMTPSTVITEIKTIVNKVRAQTSKTEDYSNSHISTVPIQKFNVIDIYHSVVNLNPLKYNAVLTNNKSYLSNNSFSSTTNEVTNQSLLNFNMENGKLSTVETPYEKPELNYSLHNQHNIMLNVNEFLTKHFKQNDNAKSSNVFVFVIKCIAVIGVLLITFKFTLSLRKWYTKKPTNDGMDAQFIEMDKESCSMELNSAE